MGLVNLTTFVYKFISDQDDSNDKNIVHFLLCLGWDYA